MAVITPEWDMRVAGLVAEPLEVFEAGPLFEDAIGRRTHEIDRSVDDFASARPIGEFMVASFDSGSDPTLRFVEHSAMIRFLAQRGLDDQYFGHVFDGSSEFGSGVLPFMNTALKSMVNWRFSVADRTHGTSQIAHKFIYQVGDDGLGWSYKMKTRAILY